MSAILAQLGTEIELPPGRADGLGMRSEVHHLAPATPQASWYPQEMSRSLPYQTSHGPFRADPIREGDPYELSNGHVIRCLPTGGRGSDAVATGAAVLKSDPEVDSAGVGTGYSPSPDTLRAPDVAVGNVPREPGWVKGVPPLAVEYADTGQDEADLATKIRELLDAGTKLIWVVRLTGPRRVEIHQSGRKKRIARPGEELRAPGILRNPVPVEALYDWEMGQKIIQPAGC